MTTMNRFAIGRTLGVLAGASCAAGMLLAPLASAQPAREGERGVMQGEPAERVRGRIESRLDEIRREEARLQEALRAIDSGEPANRVVRDVMRAAREDREGPFGDRAEEREVALSELTPERRAEILEFVKQTTPPLGERIARELEENPGRSDAIFMRLAPRVIPQIELRDRDPELFDLRVGAMRLDWQIRSTAMIARFGPESERAGARERLKALIGERVDLTLKERAMMIDRFEERIASMREELAQEREKRDEVVAEKLEEIERGEMRGPDERGGPRGGPPGSRRDRGPDRAP